ncbi:hypothetical protein NQ315_014803 [Exocentrus adspersus]|uniref:Uncharacterized protein n=1 Tax=Exocentrus adspersus TaxID=1586481 RepID=A0AAV8VMM4_9CUCU|nr:hypothetical protein NQ315_014803 [Exocentrus adspersus]
MTPSGKGRILIGSHIGTARGFVDGGDYHEDMNANVLTFKLSDVKILLENSLERVAANKWQICIHHVKKEEVKIWDRDNLIDVVVEPLVINLGDEDSSSDSEDEF